LDTTAPPPVEEPSDYNLKVQQAIDWLQAQKETLLIKEEYRDVTSCVLVEKGRFYGMGLIDKGVVDLSIDQLKEQLTPYPENEAIRSMISSFVDKHPHKVHKLTA
jgi:DNA polymerase-3 subunit epsilon